MKEISKYEVFREKLQGICDENGLVYSIRRNGYPFLLTIRPAGGMETQMSMFEDMDNKEDTGYISPEASIVFAYKDGVLTYKISETFTISEKLFSKLKNLFKNLHTMWLMYFFRNAMETGFYDPKLVADAGSDNTEDAETCEDDLDSGAFDEFMDEDDDRDASGADDE